MRFLVFYLFPYQITVEKEFIAGVAEGVDQKDLIYDFVLIRHTCPSGNGRWE